MPGVAIAIAALAIKVVILYFMWSIAKPALEDVKMVVTNASACTFLFFCLFMVVVGYMDWKFSNNDYNDGGKKEKD